MAPPNGTTSETADKYVSSATKKTNNEETQPPAPTEIINETIMEETASNSTNEESNNQKDDEKNLTTTTNGPTSVESRTETTTNGPTSGTKASVSIKDTKDTSTDAKKVAKDDNFDNETDLSAEIVVPPDGGWGWVVVFASFMCNMIVDGIIFSFGAFLKPIMDELHVEKYQVTLVQSLTAGFYLMAGPFVSALANRYGFRLVTIVGSVAGAFAFVLAYFCHTIEGLWLTYGLLGGKMSLLLIIYSN